MSAKDAPAFDLAIILSAAAALANEYGVEVKVSRQGAISIKPQGERSTSTERVKRFRAKKQGNAGNNETHETHETELSVSPSPSLSFPPSPPLAPSPSPPSPRSPTPTHPHPPTPADAREEATQAYAPSAWYPSEQQQQVNRWFHRRDSTPWTEKERKAWNAIHAESIADGLVILAPPYLAAEKFCRRDLLTLLNNWQGEIDRWRSYKPTMNSDVKPLQQGYDDPPFLTDDSANFHKQ